MQKLSGFFLFAILISSVFSSGFAFAQVGPIAQDDSYSLDEDSLLTVEPIGVLENDTNTPQSDIFHAIIQTNVGFGTLTLNQDGSFSYQPNENFDSIDSFTYVAFNGTHNSNEATVTISVNPLNDAPIANDDSVETLEDVPLNIDTSMLLTNDIDYDDDSLFVSAVTDGIGGTVSLDDNSTVDDTTDDFVTFAPISNFNGSADFTYTVSDGIESTNAKVTVNVTPQNDAPIANDDSVETTQNTPINIDVLENDSDIETDSLSILLVIDPTVTKGFVELDGLEVIFTPLADFVGSTSFSYKITDGDKTSNLANVSITVTEEQNDQTVFEQILKQIQSLFDKILNLEDEITLLKDENSALATRITELESIVENGVPTNEDDDDNDDNDNEKVIVCHKGKNSLSISKNALSAHLKHGDVEGKCSNISDIDFSDGDEIKNQIKELKTDFKIQEKELKNKFKAQEKEFKQQLKNLKKDKKSKD